MFDYTVPKMASVYPNHASSERQAAHGARGDCLAQVSVLRCAKGRGLAALSVLDRSGNAGGEHFIPFGLHEVQSLRGRDYLYAGLGAALDRLHSLNVRRAVIQVDDELLVAELNKKTEPHRDLTLLYIMVGCKLNEFSNAKVVAVPAARLERLRSKAESLAVALGRNPKPPKRAAPLLLAV